MIASVHLSEFPDVSSFPEAADLVQQMDQLQDACNAALSIRNKLNVRVRQPLQRLTVYGQGGVETWQSNALTQILKEEVNVKEVMVSDALNDVATLKLSINNPVLGKRLPTMMKQIIPASKKGEWKSVEGGGVEICGEMLLPEEFELKLEPKKGIEGAAPLSTNDALVVLDLTITPELKAEGIARDLVRLIQQARKNADLNVSDRIQLALVMPQALMDAVQANEHYIKEQTLTQAVEYDNASAKVHTTEQQLDGETVVIGFSAIITDTSS